MQILPIHPDVLDSIIREKEKGYAGTLVNLFLYPRFIDLCRQGIDSADTDERRESLETMITSHEMVLRGERESLETWELLLPYLYSLRTSLYGNALDTPTERSDKTSHGDYPSA